MSLNRVTVFWFRRDLRLDDNHALHHALGDPLPVLPVFIFDDHILCDLNKDDARLTFIHSTLLELNKKLKDQDASIYCLKGSVKESFEYLMAHFDIATVYANEDYEPYARDRDNEIKTLLAKKGIELKLYKDQLVFAKHEVLKNDGMPYTVFTPYKNKWLTQFKELKLADYDCKIGLFFKHESPLPELSALGFRSSPISVRDYSLSILCDYEAYRDFPALDKTSYLSVHLRFGTVSVRKIIKQALCHDTFLNELIWREFFMQILYHYPHVEHNNFRSKYDHIAWRNDSDEFYAWKNGETGYPMVDAGMRQLNATGYMHNRVRMITAGFLCKHLLIDWRWGEAYFAEKLLDYEMSSNNGNWQWSAGTGCDAAPYFRVFNPITQQKKFDPDELYVKKWLPDLYTSDYPDMMVDHAMARLRAIEVYKSSLAKTS